MGIPKIISKLLTRKTSMYGIKPKTTSENVSGLNSQLVTRNQIVVTDTYNRLMRGSSKSRSDCQALIGINNSNRIELFSNEGIDIRTVENNVNESDSNLTVKIGSSENRNRFDLKRFDSDNNREIRISSPTNSNEQDFELTVNDGNRDKVKKFRIQSNIDNPEKDYILLSDDYSGNRDSAKSLILCETVCRLIYDNNNNISIDNNGITINSSNNLTVNGVAITPTFKHDVSFSSGDVNYHFIAYRSSDELIESSSSFIANILAHNFISCFTDGTATNHSLVLFSYDGTNIIINGNTFDINSLTFDDAVTYI